MRHEKQHFIPLQINVIGHVAVEQLLGFFRLAIYPVE